MSGHRTELGRIRAISFGMGGYQDAMIGISVALQGKAWGVDDFKGAWATDRTDRCQWTEEDRVREFGAVCMWLRDLLRAANKQRIDQLAGVPIEATFDGNKLVSWRVLDEVLG